MSSRVAAKSVGQSVMSERVLEPGSSDIPNCICNREMRLKRTETVDRETEIRIYECPSCTHELRLTVWRTIDGVVDFPAGG
jgi:hypothetical protein